MERPIGSEGHSQVESYLSSSLADLGWTVERDEFSTVTTDGVKSFVNIIAHLHPDRPRRAVLGMTS